MYGQLPDEEWGTTISWIVHIVGVVWTMNVMLGVAWVCQSGAVCKWFFSSTAGQAAREREPPAAPPA